MDEIISLEKRRIEAMINQDANALDRILDDDLSYTHSSGQIETKAEFIANATSGVTRYRALSQEDVKVRQFGDTAIITGHGTVHVESSRGENKFPIRFIDVYVKRDGAWSRGSPRNCRTKRGASYFNVIVS